MTGKLGHALVSACHGAWVCGGGCVEMMWWGWGKGVGILPGLVRLGLNIGEGLVGECTQQKTGAPQQKESFFEHIFEHINGPLSSLFWRTEKCRTEDLRGGALPVVKRGQLHVPDHCITQKTGSYFHTLIITLLLCDQFWLVR